MAILYGTTGDGTTLPVLVDQFGNLLAKGIEGAEGPPGPEGPPGIGQLPPDPYEGAILGWEDGELSWIGGSVPLPAGTYGPYVYNLAAGYLEIPQDASDLVSGQQIYMSNQDGGQVAAIDSTDTIANVNSIVTPGGTVANPHSRGGTRVSVLFDGSTGQSFETSIGSCDVNGRTTNIQFVPDLVGATTVVYFAGNMSNGPPITIYHRGATDQTITQFGGTGEIALNSTAPIQAITMPGSTSISSWVSAFKDADGQVIQASTVLTFPEGATNFDEFAVGDVVQGGNQAKATDDTEVKITNINAEKNTISVDGGSWYAQPPIGDGSGDPDGETKISKSKSGDGSVSLGGEGVIVLRANNGEWVDDFYVTAPEQRIAARKVASSAIRRKRK